uniref:Transposase n=1 Tax=Ditylenchus dipsaci TaxID=166011 RepID=A0A915CNJ4_9BILA
MTARIRSNSAFGVQKIDKRSEKGERTPYGIGNATHLKDHWARRHEVNFGGSFETTKQREEHIQRLFDEVLAISAIPINVFMHPAIRNFLEALRFEVPRSRATLKKRLVDRFRNIQTELVAEVKNLEVRGSVTCDVWTDGGVKHAFLGITFHYYKHEFGLRRLFLGLVELRAKHTAEIIRSEVLKLLLSYGIRANSIFQIVTDNGSNMVAAFKNIIPAQQIKEELDEDDYFENIADENTNFSLEADMDDPVDEFLDLVTAFPQRLSCFAHSLQLVVGGFVRDFLSLSSGFRKMCGLIKRVKYCLEAKHVEEMTGKSVLTLSATRWGSCVDVLERYFEHSQALQVIANKKGWDCPSEYEIQYLNAVYEILLPFAEILQEVQAKNSVTISKCFGYVKALLMSFEEEEVTLVSEEKDGLRKSLLKRFSRIIDSKEAGFNPIYVMAAALDPNTADHLTDEDLEIVVDSLGNLLPTSMVEPQPEIEEMPQSSISILLAKVSSINKKKRKAVHQAQEERKGSIRLLLRALCSENFGIKNPLHYWHGLMKSVCSIVLISRYVWIVLENACSGYIGT